VLPALRQDLSLHPGPNESDGSPTWTLHDPAANRFYRLGWIAFEILSRWHFNDVHKLLRAINTETTLTVDSQDLQGVIEFLSMHHLLEASGASDTIRLTRISAASKLSHLKWLVMNYLFFRIPLLRPAVFLNRVAPYIKWVFDPRFWLAIIASALLGLYLASRQWDQFMHTFAAYGALSGLLGIGIALSVGKVVHELGHAFTAQRFGCRVPTMGIAFLVLVPVLYTDTNEAWKLPDKRQRLAIAAAGMLSELALAALATLAWSFMPDGPLRAGVFLLATSTWIVTLGINASPFMRFDGYFLLSDYLDMPNLHNRAFALTRWWLRGLLFGWDSPPPERFPPKRRRFLIVFAITTWVYRLVVFLGIAFLVYRVSFKLLGIVLLMIELGWFITMPISKELKVWWKNRDMIHWNRNTRISATLACVLLAILFVPWRSDVRAPAVLGAEQAQGLYAQSAARVIGTALPVGTEVTAGQVLVQLESPELQAHLAGEKVREQLQRWKLEQQPFDQQLRQEGNAMHERWNEEVEAVKGLQQQADQLIVRAPFSGRIAEADDDLVPGAWIARKEKLFEIVGPKGSKAEAFVDENAIGEMRVGNDASFVADDASMRGIRCRIAAIEHVNIASLDAFYLASVFGGAIPVEKDKQGMLAPTEAWYRLHLNACDYTLPQPAHEIRGVMHLQSEWHSIAGSYWKRAIAVIQREMGF
jgi:putative peptide zinc metalloprotease protein